MARRKEGARAWVGTSHRTKDLPRRDRRWEVVYEDPNQAFKRRRKGGFKSKDDAEAWRIDFLGQARLGAWHDPTRGDRLFGDVAQEWFEAQVFNKANTERTQRRIVEGERSLMGVRFRGVRVGDIKHSDVRAWVKQMGVDGKAASTIKNHFYVLRLVMRYAAAEGLVLEDPTAGIKLPTERKPHASEADRYPLTTAQIDALCSVLPQPWALYVRLAGATGMRPAEIAGLQMRDFDADALCLRVERVWSGGRYEPPKTTLSRRTIRLDTRTGVLLAGYLREHSQRAAKWYAMRTDARDPGDRLPMFVGVGEFKRGRRERRSGTDIDWFDYSLPVKHGWFYMRYWKQALEQVGLPGHLRFYDLRHAHASLIASRIGQPGALTLKECQERLGHSNMSTFYDRYVHSAHDDGDRHRKAMDDLFAEDGRIGLLSVV